MDSAHEHKAVSICPLYPARRLDDLAQRRDDLGCPLVFRPHHPIGDEAETDLAPGIGKTDLPPGAIMPEAAGVKIAPRVGIELEAIAPA
ncbi:hypothetical protein D9M68_965720 [compost metagenome]